MFSTYVIRSDDGLVYVGQTSDMEKRLFDHNNGLSKYTKRSTGWRVVHIEVFSSRSDAMKREKWLKTGVGREYIKKIIKEA